MGYGPVNMEGTAIDVAVPTDPPFVLVDLANQVTKMPKPSELFQGISDSRKVKMIKGLAPDSPLRAWR